MSLRICLIVALWTTVTGRPSIEAQGTRPPAAATRPIAIAHVTIIDVESGRELPDRMVIVRGTRIASIDSASSSAVPTGSRIVDGRGKYLIPGLWDMHMHVRDASEAFYPALIAFGVTGIRDMFEPLGLDSLRKWRGEIAAGERVGPRMVFGGQILDGPEPFVARTLAIHTPEQGRHAVDSLVDAGANFIKVYQGLPRDAFYAIADEARRRGVPFAGHLPFAIGIAEGAAAGMASMEHLEMRWRIACSDSEEAILRDITALVGGPHPKSTFIAAVPSLVLRARATYDRRRCDDAVRALAAHHTWLTPTLINQYENTHRGDSLTGERALWAKFPATVRDAWERSAGQRAAVNPWQDESLQHYPELPSIVEMQRMGVPFLAGTDASTLRPTLPGVSLHSELWLLVNEGFTPLEALRAATLNPARFLGATDSLGTVTAGKLADLVLLDGDPLADIHNIRRIVSVVANGRYFDRASLDALMTSLRE